MQNSNNPNSYTVESALITLLSPERIGYDFVGWYTESTFETKVETIAHGSTGDVELYAKWVATSYQITIPSSKP